MSLIQDYSNLLKTFPAELRRTFRDYESVSKKIVNANWSITFNKLCLKENILPDYLCNTKIDPAKCNSSSNLEYKESLVVEEIKAKENTLVSLHELKENTSNCISCFKFDEAAKNRAFKKLECILQNTDRAKKLGIIKKLNKLYNGKFFLKKEMNSFLNLSDHQLTSNEKEFLNLGLNYHIQPKYSRLHKQTELETLYNSLTELQKKKQIEIKPAIVTQLASEGTKHRNTLYKTSIRKELTDAAKDLKNNENIVLRKADKSATYVILNREDYLDKLNNILSDKKKFKCITKNPVDGLKKKANELITSLNANIGDIHLPKIIGDYAPGYIYGNVKTHKANNPLRPIISQIPTPTYNLAKSLNKIISPYIPDQYSIRSTDDFIDILHSSDSSGIVASLDVESLFTNVPIEETVDIIIENVYHNLTRKAPNFPQKILKEMLLLCTKEAPFRTPDGRIYLQIDGVAMGSPLGPTFANFYMGHLEKLVFEQMEKPSIYTRYVDDIFLQVNSEGDLIHLKEVFEKNSVLKFTYEMSMNKKLPFLDVMVTSDNGKFSTSVYHKPTSIGSCLNANSECIMRYKDSVVFSFLNRAYKISQNWLDFHKEVEYIKQMLINNNYSNSNVDALINKFVQNKQEIATSHTTNTDVIPVYYHNQTHKNCPLDEKILKEIVYNNTKCCDPKQKLKVICYYKNVKTGNLVMRNNMGPKLPNLSQTGVVYKFECPLPHSRAEYYIGMTQATVSHRLTNHAQSGSISSHFKQHHNSKPTKDILVNNTSIIAKAKNRYNLAVKEALLILNQEPSINKQFDNFTNILKLFNNSKSSINQEICKPLSQAPVHIRKTAQNPTQTHESLNPSTQNSSEDTYDSITDMSLVLEKFGVSTDFWEIPYSDYLYYMVFDTVNPVNDNTTISQRIKSMVRAARNKNTS